MLNFTEDIHKFPFIRFLIPLIGGILLAIYLPALYIPGMKWLVFTGLGILILLSFSIRLSAHKYRLWFGIIMHLSFLILGIFLVQVRVNKNEHFRDLINNGPVVGTVLRRPAEREKTFKVLIRTEFVKKDSVWEPLDFKSLVYFEKEIGVRELKPGDRILMFSKLQGFKPSGNPGEFNYSRYLSDRGVLARIYVKDSQWSKFKETNNYSILVLSAKLRHNAFQLFRENELTDDARQILSALLLGQREYIRDDLKDSFSNAGITHVMAVSGLHVGIIFIILFYLLFFLDRIKYGKAIRSIIIILVLWIYALIAGLSPSVVRAVIMFSFISIGQGMKREVNVYNSLAVAAFVLLCMNPFYLRDVGFQLSFLAVLGINYLFPIFSNWLRKVPNIFQIKNILAMSLAAQIFTLPILIYSFGRISLVAPLTNVLVLPFLPFIIIFGFLSAFFGFFSHFLALIFVFPCWLLLSYLLKIAEIFSSFVFSSIHLKISWLWLIIFYLILGFLIWNWKKDHRFKILGF